ncbi:NUDIX domain-containing protein [Caulobacter sp.]|uniref:NUDIX hydrolase n=1 Tax=Caulobacter sp. TaxID=78 RepID=UPI001AFD9BD3|nr:NUDIX domain-containing protein [Caulobacter sp.]MBO9547334.1 NUDIX domain-containing protein [Caulobacter sp.]
MRERPSSRLLVIDPEDRLLLFRFEHRAGPLAGQVFWATPGGGLHPGETYEDAARRELLEETGLGIDDPGPQVAQRRVEFRTPDGERVAADERFFLIRIAASEISRDRWTDLEREVMAEHRWWSAADLRSTTDQVWPDDLADLLAAAGVWGGLG